MIIATVICCLKRSGDERREKLAETLMSLGYKLSKADADVCMKQYSKPNGYPYYKNMLCYVDYLIHVGFKPKEDMDF